MQLSTRTPDDDREWQTRIAEAHRLAKSEALPRATREVIRKIARLLERAERLRRVGAW